jgi:RNA polymerase sigma factor (sigma-70 family)
VLGALFPHKVVVDGSSDFADREEIWACIRRLPPQQRAVIVLRFYEDLTEAQTAKVLGCHVGTVKGYTSRALAALRLDDQIVARREIKEPQL